MNDAATPSSGADRSLDDLLDALLAEYSDRAAGGGTVAKHAFLERVPPEARAGLERCLRMVDAGRAPGALRPLVPGARLGRYALVRELGRGGMALVWLARDPELARPIALKILRPGLALEASHVDRFRREALAVARLRHPSIVQIHDVGTEGGHHYLAMEYVEGPSLARVLESLGSGAARRWSAEELARAAGIPALGARGRTLEQALAELLLPVADALVVAHGSGVIHRDVKPSNILLGREGRAVVVDFGLAKSDGDPALSITGDTLGTPYYMSPEQTWLADVRVDHRTDVYSLGVCLYEALGGKRPFEGAHALEVFERIRTSLPPALDALEPRVSRDAAALVRKAMARAPERRYADARDLAADLGALAAGLPTAARREEGGPLRRAWSTWRLLRSGTPHEYRSPRTWLGLPLLHAIGGPRRPGQPKRVARGWIALSPEVAIGALACGQRAYGGVACGGIAAGIVFSWGGLSLGLLAAFGGLAAALFPCGGMALGYLAFGGVSLGYGAVGGVAVGRYAMGGHARGAHVISERRRDLSEAEFFGAVLGFDVPVLRLPARERERD
jgi:serine/threonine protein kinase